jgi:hypothetical protein
MNNLILPICDCRLLHAILKPCLGSIKIVRIMLAISAYEPEGQLIYIKDVIVTNEYIA